MGQKAVLPYLAVRVVLLAVFLMRKIGNSCFHEKSLPRRTASKDKVNPGLIKYKCNMTHTIPDVLKARGWQESDDDWDVCWYDLSGIKEMFEHCFMEDGRKISHFRNHYELTRKNLLVKNLKRLRKYLEKTQGKSEADKCDIYPTTFELPNEYHIFVEEFRKNPGTIWIMKPAAKSQGKGIFLFQKLKDITDWKKNLPQLYEEKDKDLPETYVVQRYITNPYLIGGRKFDLRVYVLVTSYNPLTVWLHREGFARFSHTKFSLDSIEDMHVHLTNVAIQRTAAHYDPERGSKWALWKLRCYLTAKHGDDVISKLMEDINDIFVKSLLCVQKVMISDKHCFELYGYDILIDSNLKPWLLEVNASPSLAASNQEDYSLKFAVLNDALDVVDMENKLTGCEKRIGGFDLLWNDGSVFFENLCSQCKAPRRPPVKNFFLASTLLPMDVPMRPKMQPMPESRKAPTAHSNNTAYP